MWQNRREGAPFRARNALAELTDRGIQLTDAVNAAVAEFDRIEAALPAEPQLGAVHDAVLAGADRDTLNALVLDELSYTRLRNAYTQATLTAAGQVLEAILGARDELHQQLASRADKAIATLQAVAATGDVSLNELVRTGRTDEAKARANLDLAAAELTALYRIRDMYLTPGGPEAFRIGHVDCSRWRDPRPVENRQHGASAGEQFLTGLAAGAALWFPPVEEARAAAQPIYDEWRTEAEAIAARQRQLGGITAWA